MGIGLAPFGAAGKDQLPAAYIWMMLARNRDGFVPLYLILKESEHLLLSFAECGFL